MPNLWSVRGLLTCLVATVLGCGGGGAGGDRGNASATDAERGTSIEAQPVVYDLAVTVTVDAPQAVTRTFLSDGQWANDPGFTRAVTLSGRYVGSPAPILPIVITDPGGVFESGPVTVDAVDGHFTALMMLKTELDPGVHVGTVGVTACATVECLVQFRVANGEIPYTVEVRRGVAIRVEVNGTQVALDSPLRLRNHDILTIRTSEPVDWRARTVGATASMIDEAPTIWSARLESPPSGDPGGLVVDALRRAAPSGGPSVAAFVFP